jgi:DNA-directed RNA polymerase specialized sigma24 family protein
MDQPTAADQVTLLYRIHGMDLIRIGAAMPGSRADAEDAVQDAFCGLFRKWNRLADPHNALPYVRSAVMNRCRSELRRDGHKPGHGQIDDVSHARRAGPTAGGTIMKTADEQLRAAARDARGIFPPGADLPPLFLPDVPGAYGRAGVRAICRGCSSSAVTRPVRR